jgi:hypothetical protein
LWEPSLLANAVPNVWFARFRIELATSLGNSLQWRKLPVIDAAGVSLQQKNERRIVGPTPP